jgi:hypothetical protein
VTILDTMMIMAKRRTCSCILATILSISLMMLPNITTTNQHQYALAKILTLGMGTFDTDKPLAPQFNQAFLKTKMSLSPAVYKSRIETFQSDL